MIKYLKEISYYEDLYDLATIEECLDLYWKLHDGMESHREELSAKNPEIDFDTEVNKCCSYTVNVIKIQRYRLKKDTISKWIDADKKLQKIYDDTPPPDRIYCNKCKSATKVIDKTLHDTHGENPRLSFMFECLKCKKRQIFYEDGSPWDYKKPRCKKCNIELKTRYETNADSSTIITYCPKCTFKDVDIIDSKELQEKRTKEENRKKNLLEKQRERFCLNDKDGPEAVSGLDSLMAISKKWEEEKIKVKDPTYIKAMDLKKLKLNQVKNLFVDATKNSGYSDLQFSKPDIGKYVTVDFSITDNIDDRTERDSINVLKKLVNTALQTSNWRLMSEGINCRLGILTGRLKAYEQEEDLISLIKNK